jgi:hypothetical protein
MELITLSSRGRRNEEEEWRRQCTALYIYIYIDIISTHAPKPHHEQPLTVTSAKDRLDHIAPTLTISTSTEDGESSHQSRLDDISFKSVPLLRFRCVGGITVPSCPVQSRRGCLPDCSSESSVGGGTAGGICEGKTEVACCEGTAKPGVCGTAIEKTEAACCEGTAKPGVCGTAIEKTEAACCEGSIEAGVCEGAITAEAGGRVGRIAVGLSNQGPVVSSRFMYKQRSLQ